MVHSLNVGGRTRAEPHAGPSYARTRQADEVRLRARWPRRPARRRPRSIDNIRAKGETRRIILPMLVRGVGLFWLFALRPSALAFEAHGYDAEFGCIAKISGERMATP